MPKLVVISFILARPVTFVSVVEGIIRMKKIYKRIIFESDREYVKDLILKLYFSIKKQQQQQTTKNKSKPRHYLHNNLRLTMVFLRCSFENSIINRLAVKYLYSFTFVYGIWKQQIQETKLIFQLNVQCIFNVLFSYGLECNDMHLSINIIIWSKSYEDEQVWKNKYINV
jgi:hypothetical protein